MANRPQNITRRLWTSQSQVPWDLLPRPWPTGFHPSLSLPSFPRCAATPIIPCRESTVQEPGLIPSARRYQKPGILSLEHQFEGSAYEHRKASVPCTLCTLHPAHSQGPQVTLGISRGGQKFLHAEEPVKHFRKKKKQNQKTPLLSSFPAGGPIRSPKRTKEAGCSKAGDQRI